MASKKLAWSRDRIMQHEYGTGNAACWAAVIESALAFYTKDKDYTALTLIEQKFAAAGGVVGKGGIRNFPAALRVFGIYDKHERSKNKFQGKYKQIFNFVKWQIDKEDVVLLGFNVVDENAAHAGMVFGYNEPDEVYFIEPGSIAYLNSGAIAFDEKMAGHYMDNAVKLEALFTAQTIGSAAQRALGRGLKMEANAIYRTKPPSAPSQPPAGQAALNPFVMNTATAAAPPS